MIFIFCLLSILHITQFQLTIAVSFDQDLTISHEQKQILDKFKDIVSPILPHEYMKMDIYLIRWLRARNFDLQAAANMLEQNLQWRKDNNMDEIHNENWEEFRKLYNYWVEGHDKAGRPMVYLDVGQWDLRLGVLSGHSQKLVRAYNKILDQVSIDIRKKQHENMNVTQYYLIVDLDQYNLIEHGCPQCIAVVLNIILSYENHFPGLCHKIAIVRTPEIFRPVLSVLLNLASPMTKETVHVYGKGKEGQTALLNDIDADQLPIEVGGTKVLSEIL